MLGQGSAGRPPVRAGRPAPCGARGAPSARKDGTGQPPMARSERDVCDPRGRLRAAPALRPGTLPRGRGLTREHPHSGAGARQPVPAVPALPTCARGAWLGMNVARGGLCPGEQHTRPCALSRGGPGRRRDGGGRGRERGRRRAGARPASAQPAGPGTGCRGCGTARGRAGWDGTARHGSGLRERLPVPRLSPRCPCGRRPGAAAPHSSTVASGRETPSQRKQESPSGTLSEQGAGREINSGVSGCPGPGRGQGDPPVPHLPPARGRSRLRPPRDYCFSQKSPFFFRDG